MKIDKPFGMNEVVKFVEESCVKAPVYMKTNLKPDNIIVHLNPKSGRTTLIEYVSDMYKKHNVLDYTTGLDPYVEITFDGTYENFKNGVNTINEAAVYSDIYTAPIAIDATALVKHKNETQWFEFVDFITTLSSKAYFIFFVDEEESKQNEFLIKTINECVNYKTVELFVSPYTINTYVQIIKKRISDIINVEKTDAFDEVLKKLVIEHNVNNLNEAILLSDSLIMSADFTGDTPVLSAACFAKKITKGGSL